MTQSIIIRAAAFWRLVANIYVLTLNNPENFIGKVEKNYFPNLEEKDETRMVLVPIVYRMHVSKDTALSIFPTTNMEMLAKAILKVVRCYASVPEIYTKINLLSASHDTVSILAPNQMSSSSIRAKEVKELNENIYLLSQTIPEKLLDVTAKLVNVTGHGFHPESEFVRFSIVMK
jgi:hypothetical protein